MTIRVAGGWKGASGEKGELKVKSIKLKVESAKVKEER